MDGVSFIQRYTGLDKKEAMRLCQQERLIFHVAEMIYRLMEEKGVTKAELAKRLKTSRSYVTQLLDGNSNMSLRKVADALWALDSSAFVDVVPLTTSAVRDKDASREGWVFHTHKSSYRMQRVSPAEQAPSEQATRQAENKLKKTYPKISVA